MRYKVLINCEDEKTEKQFKPGDVISDKTLPKYVLAHWVEKGVIEKIGSPKSSEKELEAEED